MGCRELDINYLENDQEYEVPDTPDRPAAQNYYGSGCMEKKHDFPMASHPGQTDSSEEGSRNRVRGRSDRRRLCLHSRRSPSISQNFENASVSTSSLGNSSSSKNAQWSRRPVSGKTADHENMFLLHSQGSEKVTTLHTSQQSPRAQTAVIDLTKQTGPTKALQKAFPNSASEDRPTKDTTKGPISVDGFSFLRGIDTASSMTVQNTTYKGKAKIDDSHSGDDGGKGILGGSQPKAGRSSSLSSHSILSPRVTGKKRLVRNGCIHPLNTAKSKELTENHSGFMNVHNDKEIPVSDCSPSLIRALVAEDANSQRGPGVISHFFPTKEPAAKTMNLSTRQSIPRKEEASGASNDNGDEIRCFEGSSGWRTTRTRTKNVNLPMSYEGQQVSETKDDSCFLNQQNKNRLLRRDNGKGSSDCSSNGYHDDWNAVCSQKGSALTVSQAASRHMPDQVSGHRTATRTVIKRQKQGSASSHFAESSTSTSVDSDIVFLRSSGEPSNTTSTRNQNGHGLGIMDSVIEIDDFSPEIIQSGSHNKASSSNVDSNARARQLEADEMLARELQEQLYNESPRVGHGERRSVVSNLYQQSQSRTSQTPPIRRGTQARGPSSARLTRFRSRLPRQSPRMPNQGRRSLFPPSMDFDTIMHRINMLEALEAFSEMGMTGNFLQAEGEFNEYDYETLLALDENNHQHGGASVGQINILPESTVQGSNFEEACAICLETPASGDTIRHLPCFHKFHKDCIDPWLRRRSSCPVCKSSVTS